MRCHYGFRARTGAWLRGHFGALAGALVCTVALLPWSATHAQDSTGEQLVKSARCDACHATSETLLGPPYIAIAARHAAQKDTMVDVLARKIVYGGGGNWGVVPMVPNQWVSIDDARVMAEWILSLNDRPR